MRVVSLLPSATEIVAALGIEPVGVSHECDYPPSVRDVPAINRSRIDATASSAEIDSQVLDTERDGGVYEIDLDALARADPDLVVTQGLCDVCAVDSVLVEQAIERLDLECEILTTDPHSLADVFSDIRAVGAATGRDERAADLVADLRERVERVRETTAEADRPSETNRPSEADQSSRTDHRPGVAVLDWLDPVMVAGHWVPELVELAGGRFGMADTGERSRPREWAAVREYDPDVLVAAPCGFDLEQTVENRSDLTDREGWADLAAVRKDRAYALDGHRFVNRPGPRLVDSLEHLAGLIHPDLFETPPKDAARALSALAAPVER